MKIFQIKVTLKHCQPPIWRRIEVPSDIKLGKLHRVLQATIGWTDTHLHAFRVGREPTAYPIRNFPTTSRASATSASTRSPRRAIPSSTNTISATVGSTRSQIEKAAPADTNMRYPRCTAGKRACPPEDCGGPPGYEHLLEALRDPKHGEHEELREWAGEDFDAEAFDLGIVNKLLWRTK